MPAFAPRSLLLALGSLFALGCAGQAERPPAPPALDTTADATEFAATVADADLVVHVHVTTRVNDLLPHHMAQAQLAFFNKSEIPITVRELSPADLEIEGDEGRLVRKDKYQVTPRSKGRITLAPGEMRVAYVDLLDVYEFPDAGGRFRIRFADPHLARAVHLRTKADYFVLGARAL